MAKLSDLAAVADLKSGRDQRWAQWLDRRFPGRKSVKLGYRSIFILPSKVGVLFAVVLLVMLVTSINYQNALIYAATFWLMSIGLVTMFYTFSNLHGIGMSARKSGSCFVGEKVDIPIRLQAPGHSVWSARVNYPEQPGLAISVAKGEHQDFQLSVQASKRGPLQPGRLLMESRFPLGLYRAWTWVKLEVEGLVYPEPVRTPFVLSAGGDDLKQVGATLNIQGDQDLRGIRDYQPGDSLRQIAWKQAAQGRGLKTKEFDSDQGVSCWLEWGCTQGDLEYRLSVLCGWVLQADEQGWLYGLKIPGTHLTPDQGPLHKERCLSALALYGIADTQSKGSNQ